MSNYWNPLFYTKADYVGYATPASEGGKGSENCREVLGLEFDHHAGMQVRKLSDGETPEQCAYRYVRETHRFLTDDNHEVEPIKIEGHDHRMALLRIIKNTKSGYFAFKPWWLDDGPGAKWFSQPFRVATVGMIEAERDADFQRTTSYLAEAAEQRDSIRGRKRAALLRGFAHSSLWMAEVTPHLRWPDHFKNPRSLAA